MGRKFNTGDRVVVEIPLQEKPQFKNNIGTVVDVLSDGGCAVWFDKEYGYRLHPLPIFGYKDECRGYYFHGNFLKLHNEYGVELI